MAIKNALKIKKDDPEAKIYVLYRDIRTYGFREIYYKKAREAGIVFIRYDENNLPEVSDINGVLSSVKVESPDIPGDGCTFSFTLKGESRQPLI